MTYQVGLYAIRISSIILKCLKLPRQFCVTRVSGLEPFYPFYMDISDSESSDRLTYVIAYYSAMAYC